MKVIIQGLKIPLLCVGFTIYWVAFVSISVAVGYMGLAVMAASSPSDFFWLVRPALIWRCFVPALVWTNFSVLVGLQLFCQAVASSDHDESQASGFSRIACGVIAALFGSVLLRCGGDFLLVSHLSPEILSQFKAFSTPRNNDITKVDVIVYYIIIMFYSLGWRFAPTLPISRAKRILRGATIASYTALRKTIASPGSSEKTDI